MKICMQNMEIVTNSVTQGVFQVVKKKVRKQCFYLISLLGDGEVSENRTWKIIYCDRFP